MTAGYLQPYRESHARYGAAFQVTLWASPQSQSTRFRVFTEMCFLAGKRILDAGCGRGDLADYLLQHGIEYAQYVGLDALEEVLDYARQRSLPRATFFPGDFVQEPHLLLRHRPQVVLVSGALNTMDESTILQGLQSCWQATTETLLFNFLSARCGPQAPREQPPVRRLDPLKMLDWALARTPLVHWRQDYFPHGHDATIAMVKPNE